MIAIFQLNILHLLVFSDLVRHTFLGYVEPSPLCPYRHVAVILGC